MNHPKVQLGDILAESGRKKAGNGEYPILSITMKSGLVDQGDKFTKRIASKDTSTYKIAFFNELVVGFPIDEGVLGFQTKYDAGVVSPAYDIWELKKPELTHIPYLEKYLRSPEARHLYKNKMQGAVARRRSLKKSDFVSLSIPFPSKPEQIKIEKILTSVNHLILKRHESLTKLDAFIKSSFIQLFGNPVINDKSWDMSSCLLLIPKILSGTSYGGENIDTLSEDELGVLRISAITSGNFKPSEFKAVKKSVITKKLLFVNKNDLLFSRANTRELVAACAVVDKDYDNLFLPDKLWKLELNKELVKTQFVNHLLKNESFRNTVRKLASGGHTSMLNISMKKFQSLDLIVPNMDVQEKFCAIVEKVESLKKKYQSNLQNLENLYSSLSQKAFKGELDLTKLSLPDVESEKPVDDNVIALQPVKAESGSLIEIEARQAIKYEQTPHVTADFSFDELPKTREEREALLSTLFNEQIDDKKGQTFDLETFWQDSRVQHLLWNMPEEEQSEMEKLFEEYPPTELEIWQQQGKYKDYKKIREWIVMAIKGNRLFQQFDENSGRIQLKVVE
jgi:type I restriction enzyme S subunit